jgi:hypothetical protein
VFYILYIKSRSIGTLHLLYLFVLFRVDSGVFAMMFLEHWHSPRSMIANLFKESDIPNIRIKIANDMVFSHKNTGNKGLVTSFNHKVLFCVFFHLLFLVCSIYFCILILFSLLIVLSEGSEQLNSLLIQMFSSSWMFAQDQHFFSAELKFQSVMGPFMLSVHVIAVV